MDGAKRAMNADPSHGDEPGGVRRLYPEAGQLPLDRLYAGLTLPPGSADRPAWVALCMVASLDGSAVLDGLSAGLGGAADRRALSRLRGACDAVLVGAATVRREGYGPLVGTAERREDRVRRGLRPVPRLAILTASADLDPDAEVFGDPRQRPLLLVPRGTAPTARRRLGAVADVAVVGDDRRVDPAAALGHLAGLGLARVVCEGGPRVNAQLLAAGLVDEAFVTVAPLTVGGSGPRIAQGLQAERAQRLRLESVLVHDGELLLRYRDARHPPVGG